MANDDGLKKGKPGGCQDHENQFARDVCEAPKWAPEAAAAVLEKGALESAPQAEAAVSVGHSVNLADPNVWLFGPATASSASRTVPSADVVPDPDLVPSPSLASSSASRTAPSADLVPSPNLVSFQAPATLPDNLAALALSIHEQGKGKPMKCPEKGWEYIDEDSNIQGPFDQKKMRSWYKSGHLCSNLLLRAETQDAFAPLCVLFPEPMVPFSGFMIGYSLQKD